MCTWWNGIFSSLLRELWTYWISSTLTTSCRSFCYQLPISSTSVHKDFSGHLLPCKQDSPICVREREFSNITCRRSDCSCSRSSSRRKTTTQYRGCCWAPSPFPGLPSLSFSVTATNLPVYHNSEMKRKKRKGHNPVVKLSMPGYPCVVPNFRSPRSHLDKLCSKDIYPSKKNLPYS